MDTQQKRPASRRPAQKRRPAPAAKQTKSPGRKPRRPDSSARQPRQVQKEPAKRVSVASRPSRPVRQRPAKRAESQVVYTPPKSFNKYHLLLGIASVAAIVLALTLAMSIFFKVENIHIAGTDKYSAWDIREASGIQQGDNLLTLGKAKVSGKIIARLPYVEKVRIGIKLPDTVNIEVVESDVTYAIQAEDQGWWFINSQGRVLDMTTGIVAEYFTKIEGVKIMIPVTGQQAVAFTGQTAAPEGETTDPAAPTDVTEEPTAPVETVNAAEQLTVAISLLQNLESNGIVGEVTNVNVTDLYNIELTYEDRYQVLLGDISQLDRKIRSMREAVQQMSDYQQGVLDVSFTIWPDRVGYTPATD